MQLDNTRLLVKLHNLSRMMDASKLARRNIGRVSYLEWYEMYKQAINTYVALGWKGSEAERGGR